MIILSEILNFCPTLHSLARWRYLRREHQTHRSWWWAFIWCYLLRFSGKTFYYTSAILPIWYGCVIAAWSLPLCLMIRIKSSDIYVQKWNTSISAFDQDFLARLSYKYLGHIIPFIVCLTVKKRDGNMEHEELYQVSDGFATGDTWMIGGIRFCSHKYFGSLAAT